MHSVGVSREWKLCAGCGAEKDHLGATKYHRECRHFQDLTMIGVFGALVCLALG